MIKPKKGKCIDCPEDKAEQWLAKNKPPICRYHNEKRKVEKKKEGGKAPYRYVRKTTGELDVMISIGESREHKSIVSGEYIYNLTPSNMAHVLSKKQFPLFRLRPENIQILTVSEHTEYDQGSIEKLRANPLWDNFFKLREELLQEYKDLETKLKLQNGQSI